jgi:hypothetical protein
MRRWYFSYLKLRSERRECHATQRRTQFIKSFQQPLEILEQPFSLSQFIFPFSQFLEPQFLQPQFLQRFLRFFSEEFL